MPFVPAVVLIVMIVVGVAGAQVKPEPEGAALPDYARVVHPTRSGMEKDFGALTWNGLPAVMLTGYWPPTNEMIRRFSPDPVQNPSGWIGENWERRGYNVFAFFPEFPSGLGKGEGDFEVDYQDTSDDFWRIAGQIKPRAILTFGRAYPDLEMSLVNTPFFAGFLGTLDAEGGAVAVMDTQAPVPGAAGLKLRFAYALSSWPPFGWYASNDAEVRIVP